MRNFMRTVFLILAIISLAACSDPYGASAKVASDIGAGVGAGISTVQSLQASGTISTAEAINAAGYLKFVNDADGAFEVCITSAHTSGKIGGFTGCAQVFLATLNNPGELALIHVSNSSASQTLANISSAFLAGLQTLLTALGGK